MKIKFITSNYGEIEMMLLKPYYIEQENGTLLVGYLVGCHSYDEKLWLDLTGYKSGFNHSIPFSTIVRATQIVD